MEEQTQGRLIDDFDRAKEQLQGLPGFIRKRSVVESKTWSLIPAATWIIETIRTDESSGIFLQSISAKGGQRVAIPDSVAQAIFRQYEGTKKIRRKVAGKRAAMTRREKQTEQQSE